MKKSIPTLSCPTCHQVFDIKMSVPVRYCPSCGNTLPPLSFPIELLESEELVSNRYQLLENIGKGGMGEVFLAFDTSCGRRIALKRIRSDLLDHPHIRHRFLKEAHITSQLTHPAIIPIYSIQSAQLSAYYTMPFVEGETLKQIIRKTRQQERKGDKLDHVGGSIPALMRIFITICQAVAYAHAKGVLHRDLKPENIIVGKYGEVLILDWGLAKYIYSLNPEEEEFPYPPTIPLPKNAEITRTGKVVGTISYMAPERVLGKPATIQTDIYALGVILYQLLTLKSPFKRGTLEEFRKNIEKEEWINPVLIAPYRDVPRILARMTEKALHKIPSERYQSVDEMIYELENYLEGRSEWFFVAELDIKQKSDWEFQEHVLIAEHIAITRSTEETEWVHLMISNQSFTGNIQIETSVCIGEKGKGIGILFSVPESGERICINDGYCLSLGTNDNRTTKLLRSNVEVMQAPDIFLKRNQWIRIRIEKIENSIHFYLDDVLQFSYIAHLPMIGTHIGFLSRDADFEMETIKTSVGSLNLTVNCLAVPDAFLAHRDFNKALSEYRRIAYSFPDRVEGREGLFRAGLTFIEQAKAAQNDSGLLDEALQEFEKLHGTPSAPLEYLGKALVYQILNDHDEEIKCFELAYRRYPKHPLLPLLQEQILLRMHEVSRQQRMNAYRFILLIVRLFPPNAIDTHTRRLLNSLQKHWEILPFIEEQSTKVHSHHMRKLAIPLSFWLAKPYILGEIIDDFLKSSHPSITDINNALASLIELGAWEYAQTKIEQIKSIEHLPKVHWKNIEGMISCHLYPLKKCFGSLFRTPLSKVNFSTMRTILYFMDRALDNQQTDLIYQTFDALEDCKLSYEMQLELNIRRIWALLLEKQWKQAGEVIYTYPIELLNKDTTLLHFLYGCWLLVTEGTEISKIHLMGLYHVTYPRTWTLASHEIMNDLTDRGWLNRAFLWEKKQLYRQLALYYHCAGEEQKSQSYFRIYKKQNIA